MSTVHAVRIDHRDDGLYLFDDPAHAAAFAAAVAQGVGSYNVDTDDVPLVDDVGTLRDLIGQELEVDPADDRVNALIATAMLGAAEDPTP